MPNQNCAQSQFTREEEREANLFAQELLLPEDLVREKALEHDFNVTKLSIIFGVPKTHVLVRLIMLGFPHNLSN